MKLLAFVIVILFAATGLTLFAVENPGYALLARSPWSVEMPLTLFVILLLVLIAITYFVIYGLVRIYRIPRDVARWRTLRHNRRAQESLNQGLLRLAEGNWVEAEKGLLSDLRFNDQPLLNYLGAALAAQGQNDPEKRNEYLSLAHQHGRSRDLAIGMMQAYLHHLAHQQEQALAILTHLRVSFPEHPQLLRLLASVYRELKDWTSLANLTPQLRRARVFPPSELEAIELQASRELLMLPLPSGSMAVLEKAWRHVPEHLHHHPALIEIYAHHLIRQHEADKAEAVLRDAIIRSWNENLVQLYGRVRSRDIAVQFEAAQSWLGMHQNSAGLHLALGRLAQQSKLKAKAKEHFEKALTLRESPEVYLELAALLEQSGLTDQAREYYRRGLCLCAGEEAAVTQRTSMRAQEDIAVRR